MGGRADENFYSVAVADFSEHEVAKYFEYVREAAWRVFNASAFPEMSSVSFEQYVAASFVDAAAIVGHSNLPALRPVLPSVRIKATDLPLGDVSRARTLICVLYQSRSSMPPVQVRTIGTDDSDACIDAILEWLRRFNLSAHRIGPSAPVGRADIPAILLTRVGGSPLAGVYLDEHWENLARERAGRSLQPASAHVLNGENGRPLAVNLRGYSHPYQRRIMHEGLLPDASAAIVARASLRSFYGASLLSGMINYCDSIDKWREVSDNQNIAERLDRFDRSYGWPHREREMAEREPTSDEIVLSVIEQVQRVRDPLARLAIADELTKPDTGLMPALYAEMIETARLFREGDGTWREIGEHLGVTPQAAQQRFDPDARRRRGQAKKPR